MKNLLNFFFSFDKLFKEKLVVPFFWLALIVTGLAFFANALDAISLDPLAKTIEFIGWFAEILLALVFIRIISEIFVAIFRINDNVSPDGGKSELADIDPVAEARRAAEAATARTRELAQSATDRAKMPKVYDSKPASSDKPSSVMGKGSIPKAKDDPVPVKALEPSAVDGQAVKKRGPGRPKGSKNKSSASKPTTAKATTATKTDSSGEPVKRGRGRPKGSKNKPKTAEGSGPTAADSAAPVKRGRGRPKGSKNKTSATGTKPGPKKGKPIPRDADGNLLKKDGTPRKKPGPKAQPDS